MLGVKFYLVFSISGCALMSYLTHFIDIMLHLDKHLAAVAGEYGPWTLALLVLIVFCETGLVVTPFLPGDSLLFAAGALAAGGFFDLTSLIVLLILAAIIGDGVNYHIGKYIGPKVFSINSRFIKRSHLERTQRFFDKYGAKAIVLARFVPIVRTFAPFLAGVGTMSYAKFLTYNVVGAIVWVMLFVLAGYFFGAIPVVQKNFPLVILAIIVVSILPIVIELIRARKEPTPAL